MNTILALSISLFGFFSIWSYFFYRTLTSLRKMSLADATISIFFAAITEFSWIAIVLALSEAVRS